MKNAIKIEGLTKRYEGFCLDHVDITVPTGSIVGLIGENGAGKTTVIKVMLQIVHPDEGTVEIFGKDMKTCGKEIKEDIGFLLQRMYQLCWGKYIKGGIVICFSLIWRGLIFRCRRRSRSIPKE